MQCYQNIKKLISSKAIEKYLIHIVFINCQHFWKALWRHQNSADLKKFYQRVYYTMRNYSLKFLYYTINLCKVLEGAALSALPQLYIALKSPVRVVLIYKNIIKLHRRYLRKKILSWSYTIPIIMSIQLSVNT